MTQNWQQFIQQFPISTPCSKILVDLSHFAILKVSGPDAGKFLQGQITCEVLGLKAGEHTLGAYCNIKGRVESLFRIWYQHDSYYLRMPNNLIEPTINELQKYAIFSKVQMHIVSEHLCGFGLCNDQIDLPSFKHSDLAILNISHARSEIYGPFNLVSKLWQHCSNHAKHVDPYVWDLLDIQAGLPELYPATVDEFFPHDLNLPALNAVSFNKGCYRGQEVIARMQHRGKLKRSLYVFKTSEDNLSPGDKITAGGPEQETIAGTIVRACQNNDGGGLGLAVITDALRNEPLSTHIPPIRLEILF